MHKSIHTSQYKQFCKLMVSARESAGLTQLDLAVRLRKPQSYISKYENGERRLDVIEFLRICEVLEIDPVLIIDKLIKGDKCDI